MVIKYIRKYVIVAALYNLTYPPHQIYCPNVTLRLYIPHIKLRVCVAVYFIAVKRVWWTQLLRILCPVGFTPLQSQQEN